MKFPKFLFTVCCNRPCAADIRILNFLDIFHITSGKRMVVSIAFSRKRALAIMCRYVVQFQLGTTRLLSFLLSVERTQQVMDATTLYCTVSCHSKWWIYCIFLCWMTSQHKVYKLIIYIKITLY